MNLLEMWKNLTRFEQLELIRLIRQMINFESKCIRTEDCFIFASNQCAHETIKEEKKD